MEWNVEEHRIFETLTGSQMYGTSTPQSDTDLRGVVVPPLPVLLDPFHGFDQADDFEGQDRCLYDLGKFMKLAADANPNVIELLFTPPNCWVHADMRWLALLEKRSLFVSKKARHTFTGYAFAQLKRIETHRSYLLNPPKQKPAREAYGLTNSPKLSYEQVQAVVNLPDDAFAPEYVEEARKERAYRSAKENWDKYVSWRDARNPKRKELEAKYGYDTKHASHLVRLMDEGKELLLTGKITFPLPNAEEVRAIKNGALTYDQLLDRAKTMEADFGKWEEQSSLPFGPDWKGLKELYYTLVM